MSRERAESRLKALGREVDRRGDLWTAHRDSCGAGCAEGLCPKGRRLFDAYLTVKDAYENLLEELA